MSAVKFSGWFLLSLFLLLIQASGFAQYKEADRDRPFELYGKNPVSQKHIQYLNEILPLYEEDYLVETIEKIDGHLKSDGHIYLLHMLKADALTKQYDEYKGIAYLTDQIDKYPKEAMYYLLRGVFLYKHHFYKSATEDLSKAVSLNKTLASAYYYQHLNYFHDNKPGKALSALRNAVKYDSENDVYCFYFGELSINIENIPEGIEYLKRAVELAPDNMDYIQYLGEVLMRKGKAHSVLPYFDAKIKKYPLNEWLVNSYVMYLIYINRLEQAFQFVGKQLEKYPQSEIYHYNIGHLYQFKKEYQKSLDELLKSLELKPDYLLPKLQLYRVYWLTEKYAEAEKLMEELSEKKVNDISVYIYLARLYNYQNRVYSAEEVILNGLNIDPVNEHLLYEYSQVLYKRKRFKESISILKGLSGQYTKNTTYIGELGVMYYKTGDVDMAEKYLKQVVDKENDLYRYYLVDVYERKKNLPALYNLAKFNFRDKQVQATVQYSIARFENDLRHFSKALVAINKALVLNPNNPIYPIMEAEIYGNLNKPTVALDTLDRNRVTAGSQLAKQMKIKLLLATKEDKTALQLLKDYNAYYKPELFMVLAEDYLTEKAYFTGSDYADRKFNTYYETLMRNPSYFETVKRLKPAPVKYRSELNEILFSKFSVNEENREDLTTQADINRQNTKTNKPLTREARLLEIFSLFDADTQDEKRIVLQAETYTKLYGKNPYVVSIKADALLGLKRYDEAVNELYWLKIHYPENEWSLIKLAYAYDFQKKQKEAQNIYVNLLKKYPNNPLLLNNLAWLYITSEITNLKKPNDALTLVNKAINIDPRPEYLDTKAEVLYQKGEYKAALSLIEQALVTDDSDADHFKRQRRKILNALKPPE